MASESSYSINGPLVMPFANVMNLPYPEKLRATQLAGFGGLSLHPHEVRKIVASGISTTEMLRMAKDHGVMIVRLDPLTAWNPSWLPDNMPPEYVPGHDIPSQEFFNLCENLHCTYASLNASFPADRLRFNEIVDYYAATCRLGAEYGVTCDLENLPMWGVATLKQSWDIVRAAGQSNGGLVYDILHYIRSNSDIETLRSIPGNQIHVVQLNDGPLQLAEGVSLQENCFDRLWPGEGEFPLIEVLRVLGQIEGLNQVNPEVFSPRNKGKTAEEIARLSSESIRKILDAAEISYNS